MFEVILIISTLFFLLLTYFFYIILKLHDKKSKEYEIKLDKIKLEHEKNLLITQIEMQEQTFQNISREIHDNILQKLTLAKLYFYREENIIRGEATVDSIKLITEVISDLGDISRSLSSDIILKSGLIKALESEIAQLKKLEKHAINFTVNGEHIFLNNRKELILFRIMQECLNNVVKHADSDTIDIYFDFGKLLLTIGVKDYGKGYDPDNIRNNKSAGITNMIKRAVMIGGNLEIESKINKGTLIKIIVPYET